MCLLAIHYQILAEAPVLVAANREEFFDRPSLSPHVQPGRPRVLCGLDQRAGGTWLGVNEHGLLVAVTNRKKSSPPEQPRSRGALCRELLNCRTAAEAGRLAETELASRRYAGANYAALDAQTGFVVHGGDRLEMVSLRPGLHLLTNGDLDDPRDARQRFARELFSAQPIGASGEFLEIAARVCATGPDPVRGTTIVLRGDNRGTVSSTLVALTTRQSDAAYRHAAGPPDRTPYEDYSPKLQETLDGA
jgi:Transport and Golgi organisation 2